MITVTNAERSILNLLWKKSPRTLGEITREIRKEHNWSENAVKILVARLMRKGVVTRESILGLMEYFPAMSNEEVEKRQRKGIRLWHRLTDNEAILLVNTKRPSAGGMEKGC